MEIPASIFSYFIHIRLVEPNGKMKLMAKCKECHCIIVNCIPEMREHVNHECVQKYQFRYNRVTKTDEKMTVFCLKCHKHYYNISQEFMEVHRSECDKMKQSMAEKPQTQQKATATTRSLITNTSCVGTADEQTPSLGTNCNRPVPGANIRNAEDANNQSTTNTAPLQQFSNIAPANSKQNAVVVDKNPKTVVVANLNDLQYKKIFLKKNPESEEIQCLECCICKKVLSMQFLLNHRIQCKVVQGNQINENTQSSEQNDEEIPDQVVQQPLECLTDDNRSSSESEDQETSEHDEEEPEILISVQTVHTENKNTPEVQPNTGTKEQANSKQRGTKRKSEPLSKVPRRQACFICNTTDSDSFMNLYGTTSAYTNTSIYNFVWKWLGGKPSVRNATTDASNLNEEVICTDCLDSVNDYDEAILTAKRYKKQLCDKLTKTEEYFEQAYFDRNDTNDSESDASEGSNQCQITLAPDCDVIDLCDD